MTMPHLMNCSHNGDGWCIPCVKQLWEEKEYLDQKIDLLLTERDQFKKKIEEKNHILENIRILVEEQ